MTIQLKRNDTKDTISYTIMHPDGTAVDLTGAAVRFVMGKKTLITNAAATIVDATAGKVEYTLTDADTLVAGTFNAEFEVTFSDGKVKTYPNNGYILVNIQANVDSGQSTYVEDAIALRVSDIEVFKTDVNEKVAKVDNFQAQIDQLVVDGDSSVESAQARVAEDGTTFTTLKKRLDSSDRQLAQNVNYKNEIPLTAGIPLENITFSPKNIQRLVFDDGILLNRTRFIADMFEPIISGQNGGTNYFTTVIQNGVEQTKTVNNSVLKITNNDSAASEQVYFPRFNLGIPHQFVTMEIKEATTTSGTNPKIIYYKDSANHISVILKVNGANATLQIFGRIAAQYVTEDSVSFPVSFPCKIGFLLTSGFVTGLTKFANEDWVVRKYTNYNGYVNLNDKTQLKAWNFGFGAYLTSGAYVSIKDYSVYLTPQLGQRDHTLVTYRDGSPFMKDGRVYFTATLAGYQVRDTGVGILSYDPHKYDIRLESVLYNTVGNGIYGDGQCFVMYDEVDDIWRVWFSGYASNERIKLASIPIYYAETKSNILSGAHALYSTALDLGYPESWGHYDATVIYDKDINKWRMLYTVGNVGAVLMESTNLINWSLVTELRSVIAEGTKIIRANGKYWCAGALSGTSRTMVFTEYPTLANYKAINLSVLPGHHKPHPTLIPIPVNKSTRYQIITMDGGRAVPNELSWGNTWIYESDKDSTGFEFPKRGLKSLF